MSRRRKAGALIALLLALLLVLSSCAAGEAGVTGKRKKTSRPAETATVTPAPEASPAPEATEEPGPRAAAQRLADYLFEYGELPDTFLTKKEVQALGWHKGYRYVSDAAPGMSIGGDYFGNYEGKLPVVKGRRYYEADCWYQGGPRNEYRIIYSTDGHVWYTEDHYETFEELFPSGNPPGAG